MNISRRSPSLPTDARVPALRHGEQGYALLAVLVAVFLVLLALSIAAPTVARSLRRERELEAVHRANQYTRAIQLYYRRFGHYPGSIEQLQKSNEIRFLRQPYPDPMTGKQDWRLIKVGENKTDVKGFFGKPLAGVASSGLGSAAGMASNNGTGTPASTLGAGGSALGSSPASSSGTNTSSSPSSDSSAFGASSSPSMGSNGSLGTPLGATDASSGSTGTSVGAGISSQSATGITGTNAPFLGVGLPVAGNSILTVSEKTAYPDWEFLYDPRIEQLRAKVNILGGGIGSTPASSLGSAGALSSPTAAPGVPGSPTQSTDSPSSPATPTDPGKNPIYSKPE